MTEVERAAALLAAGGVVAFPTETVYGLGADAEQVAAVRRVFAIKQRPVDHPLIVHLPRDAGLDGWATDVPDAARRLAEAFWPGPLTLLLARGERVPSEVTGGRPAVGLRVPSHPVALALLDALAADGRTRAIAAPSANRFGRVSPTSADHVRADLGDDVDLVLDGGACPIGVESTILDLTDAAPKVLRVGAIGVGELAEVLGERPHVVRVAAARSAPAPGMLASHYAPEARVVLVDPGDDLGARVSAALESGPVAVLAPTAIEGLPAAAVELEPAGPPERYARVLYDRLRQADRLGMATLIVVPPPAEGVGEDGLGDAVRDRLSRAAGPRPGSA